ncbi:MAG: hypothetical protein HYY24_00985 [Verrucomicrobia bacterium]|nr:hypothetical protein [Verrucomicrobiota bacterium]
MTYFHTFWTWPQFASRETQQSQDIGLWDFEALTWLTSALEIRRHSPLRLITDSRGLRFVQRVGLDWVYSGGISTALDAIPDSLHKTIFWAAGKVFACLSVDAPWVSLDPDAILWQPLEPTAPVMALHPEPRDWPFYCDQQQKYGAWGFNDGWDWDLDPLNTAVAYCATPEAARFYAETAVRFMLDFSVAARRENFWGKDEHQDFFDAMLFAEQRLLPMCMKRLGVEVAPLGRLQPAGPHLERNPLCAHLWLTKDAYRDCPEARLVFVNFLIERLLARHLGARPTLAKWRLDGPRTLDALNPPAPTDGRYTSALSDKYYCRGASIGRHV